MMLVIDLVTWCR